MCLVFSLIPATIFTTIGYFVLFSSSKVEGATRKFGQVLAVWIFIIAVFPIICGTYMTLSSNCPMEKMIEKMHMVVEK